MRGEAAGYGGAAEGAVESWAWARSLAEAGEERHDERRARAADLVALADGDDPIAAAWALVAWGHIAAPADWHARRERVDPHLPPDLAARVALTAGTLAIRAGEARAGVAEAERAARLADAVGDVETGAMARIQLAVYADWRNDRAATWAFLDAASALLGTRRSRARCVLLHRQAYHAACNQQHDLAEAACLEGIEVARSLALPGFVASLLFVRALVALDRGGADDALALLDEVDALDLHDPDGIRLAERDALRARIALIHGRLDDAEARLGRLVAWSTERGWPRKAAMFHAERAMARSQAGRAEEARADAAAARAHLAGTASEDWADVAALFARAAVEGWRPGDAERVAAYPAPTPAARALRRWMRERAAAPSGPTLVVDGDAVELSGTRVDLGRAPIPRRLLARLVRARVEGEPGVSVADLAEAVWPGERMLAESRQERVWATVYRLRKLGLGDLVQSGPEGYGLRPDLDLVLRVPLRD